MTTFRGVTGSDLGGQLGVFALSNGYVPPPLRPPSVITEMIELLQDSPLAGPQTLIRHGLLPELPKQRERVYLLSVSAYSVAPESRAHRVRREDFGVRGLIEVHELGEDGPESAYGRAWALLSALDEALHIEQSLDAGARYSGLLAVAVDEVVPQSDGWLARIIFTVAMESVR